MSPSPIEWIRRAPILMILATNLFILLNIIRILITQGTRCISKKKVMHELILNTCHVTDGEKRIEQATQE
jgi:hypothetical protein